MAHWDRVARYLSVSTADGSTSMPHGFAKVPSSLRGDAKKGAMDQGIPPDGAIDRIVPSGPIASAGGNGAWKPDADTLASDEPGDVSSTMRMGESAIPTLKIPRSEVRVNDCLCVNGGDIDIRFLDGRRQDDVSSKSKGDLA